MMPIGMPEFAYAASVGLVVGVTLGIRKHSSSGKLPALIVTCAVCCGLLGALGLPLMTWAFEAVSGQSRPDDVFLLMLIAGGGISLVIGTPFAVAISWAVSRFRRTA